VLPVPIITSMDFRSVSACESFGPAANAAKVSDLLSFEHATGAWRLNASARRVRNMLCWRGDAQIVPGWLESEFFQQPAKTRNLVHDLVLS
jgi:hypothetical protein